MRIKLTCCNRDQYLASMITSHLHLKSNKACIITRSPSASLLLKGLATKHATVKWTESNLEVTIHKHNVSTFLCSAFIRGDLIVATRGPFMSSPSSCPFFWRGVNMRQVVSWKQRISSSQIFVLWWFLSVKIHWDLNNVLNQGK